MTGRLDIDGVHTAYDKADVLEGVSLSIAPGDDGRILLHCHAGCASAAVLAARGFGASDSYLLARHVLPQTYGLLLTQMALLIPQYILAEVTLSYLGLGVGEPMPSWGSLFATLQQYYILASYWWMFLPALILIPVFLAYYAMADAMQERLKSMAL